jgi:dihydroorotate dehydrogenase (fumarate)
MDPNSGYGNKNYGSRDGIFLNAVALSNAGLKYALVLHKKYNKPLRPCIMSVTPEVILSHAKVFKNKWVEINMSCPNGKIDPIAYNIGKFQKFMKDLYEMRELLNEVYIGLKLPPYTLSMEKIIKKIANIINSQGKGLISWVTCCNTVPNVYMFDPETRSSPLIKTGTGYAAMSGPAIKPICLSNVRMYSQYLNKTIAIIGSGGIRTGRDVYEYILSGATAVQIGSGLIDEGLGIFKKINQEMGEIMKKYNIQSLSEIRKIGTKSKL